MAVVVPVTQRQTFVTALVDAADAAVSWQAWYVLATALLLWRRMDGVDSSSVGLSWESLVPDSHWATWYVLVQCLASDRCYVSHIAICHVIIIGCCHGFGLRTLDDGGTCVASPLFPVEVLCRHTVERALLM